MFIVEVANYSPQIINRIKELDGVDSVRPIVNYAHHFSLVYLTGSGRNYSAHLSLLPQDSAVGFGFE